MLFIKDQKKKKKKKKERDAEAPREGFVKTETGSQATLSQVRQQLKP